MVARMKTTIEISDPLLEAAKEAAARDGISLRALVELGLRNVLENSLADAPFTLRRVSFSGDGLREEAEHLTWDELRENSYFDGER